MQLSIWEKESFYQPTDVLIVGAGLVGLWSAYELALQKPGLRIAIVEQGIIPTGASTRNAGFACFGSPTELLSNLQTIGEDATWQSVEMRFKGIEKIRNVLSNQVIDFDACGGYECLSGNLQVIDDELNVLNKSLAAITGIKTTFSRANEKLSTFGFSGFDALIENKLEGGLHSGKMVQALTKKVQQMGVAILYGINVEYWEDNPTSIKVFTTEGITFTTSRLVLCTNAFVKKLVPNSSVVPGRGQVVVTSPIDKLPFSGTFHFDEGFYYFRNLGNRVLLGGARNKAFEEEATTELLTTTLIQQELERFLGKNILPNQTYTIEHRWSGIMGFTEKKKPELQHISNHVISVSACNGMGVALSPIIGEIVASSLG